MASPSSDTPDTPLASKAPALTVNVSKAQLARLDSDNKSGPSPKSAPVTPSSTVAECGDIADLSLTRPDPTGHVMKVWNSPEDVEPKAKATEKKPDIPAQAPAQAAAPAPAPASASAPDPGADQWTRRSSSKGPAVNERPSRSVHGGSSPPVNRSKLPQDLAQENRGLHQRISALQRSEQQLVKDNQGLNFRLLSLLETQEAQQRRFEYDMRKRQMPLEAKIQELERQVAQQKEQISQLATQPQRASQFPQPAAVSPKPTVKWDAENPISTLVVTSAMTDADISNWFSARGTSWSSWVDEFAHHNPNRLAELHQLQQREVYEGIRGFVQLTKDNKLPEPLASADGTSSVNTTRLLLNGMLADFVVTETLSSPFWIFAALSQDADTESPVATQMHFGPRSEEPQPQPMEKAMMSNTGMAPLPSPWNVPPAPTTARSLSMLSPRHARPSITPLLRALSLDTKGSTLEYSLPAKSNMEDLNTMLSKIKGNEETVNAWRAQLMQMLLQGGLSRDAADPALLAGGKDGALLAQARREHARQLRDRFLGSAARFLLHDQDAQGIAKLEGQLTSELDLALRFSAQIWARPAPLRLIGFEKLGGLTLGTVLRGGSGTVVEVCLAQRRGLGEVLAGKEGEDRKVIMVVQPAVGTREKVWVKAQVLVSTGSLDKVTEKTV